MRRLGVRKSLWISTVAVIIGSVLFSAPRPASANSSFKVQLATTQIAVDNLSDYPDAISKSLAQIVVDTKIARYDAGDLMPSDMQKAYWGAVLKFVQNQSQLDAILADLDHADRSVTHLQSTPRGLLRVNAPMSFGTIKLGPVIADFMALHPELQIQLVLSDEQVDPVQEGLDVTLRIAELESSSLIARKIIPIERVLCASPDYLKSAGTPKTPDDLLRHRCLIHKPPHEPKPFDLWTFEKRGVRKEVRLTPALLTNDREGLITAAVNGAGIARSGMFDPGLIASGRLQPLLTDWACIGKQDIYALYRKSARTSPKVAAFIEYAAQAMNAFDPGELTLVHNPRLSPERAIAP